MLKHSESKVSNLMTIPEVQIKVNRDEPELPRGYKGSYLYIKKRKKSLWNAQKIWEQKKIQEENQRMFQRINFMQK